MNILKFQTDYLILVLGVFVNQIKGAESFPQTSINNGSSGTEFAAQSTIFADVGCNIRSTGNITGSTKKSELLEECTIDMDVMRELLELILAAQDIIKGPESLSKARLSTQDECSLNPKYQFSRQYYRSTRQISAECQALVDNMRDNLIYITEQIQLLVDYVVENGGVDYLTIIAQLQERIMRLQREVCDLKTEHNQELEALKQELLKQQQCFIMQLNEKQKKIEKLEMTLHDERLRAMVSKLQAGQVGQVYSDFLSRNNDSVLEPLVREAYSPEYLEYISTFAKMLPHAYQRLIVYNATFMSMGEQQHFTTANIFLLLKILKDEPDKSLNDFGSLLANCTTFSNVVITIWGATIRSGNVKLIQPIIEFGSPPKKTFAGHVFSEMLPQILRAAYSDNTNNVDALISFTGRLRWNEHKYTAVTNLTAAFKSSGDKLKMAFKVVDILANLDGPDGNDGYWEQMYDNYKTSLKVKVRSVVWHTRCKLGYQSSIDRRFYYLKTNGVETDFVNHPIAASINIGPDSWWKIESFLEGNTRYFRIKNEYNGEYLGAHLSYAESGSNGKVVTAKSYGIDKRYNVWAINYGDDQNHNEILLRHQGRPGNLDSASINLSGSGNTRSMYHEIECE